MNSFTRFFQGFAKSLSKLVHDFWKDYFRKPKLLPAANRLIYVNNSIGISKIHGLTTSAVNTSSYLFYFMN